MNVSEFTGGLAQGAPGSTRPLKGLVQLRRGSSERSRSRRVSLLSPIGHLSVLNLLVPGGGERLNHVAAGYRLDLLGLHMRRLLAPGAGITDASWHDHFI